MKIFLFILFVSSFLLLIVLPAWRVYHQTGIWPIRTKNEKSVHAYSASLVKFLWALPLVSVLLYSFGGKYYTYLVPLTYLQCDGTKYAGLVLAGAGILFAAVAQYQMGQSWRIGIDDQNKTALIQSGVYKISRNPIYLGLMVVLTGLFLIIPDLFTFTTLFTTYVAVSIQIRMEEEFLTGQHGQSYLDYMNRVRRWI